MILWWLFPLLLFPNLGITIQITAGEGGGNKMGNREITDSKGIGQSKNKFFCRYKSWAQKAVSQKGCSRTKVGQKPTLWLRWGCVHIIILYRCGPDMWDIFSWLVLWTKYASQYWKWKTSVASLSVNWFVWLSMYLLNILLH